MTPNASCPDAGFASFKDVGMYELIYQHAAIITLFKVQKVIHWFIDNGLFSFFFSNDGIVYKHQC